MSENLADNAIEPAQIIGVHPIENVLRQTEWNKSKAAKELGLTRTQLYVRLRKYGLENAQTP